jgi:hypothetical protein
MPSCIMSCMQFSPEEAAPAPSCLAYSVSCSVPNAASYPIVAGAQELLLFFAAWSLSLELEGLSISIAGDALSAGKSNVTSR